MDDMDNGQWYMLIAMFISIWLIMLMRFWNKVGIQMMETICLGCGDDMFANRLICEECWNGEL